MCWDCSTWIAWTPSNVCQTSKPLNADDRALMDILSRRTPRHPQPRPHVQPSRRRCIAPFASLLLELKGLVQSVEVGILRVTGIPR